MRVIAYEIYIEGQAPQHVTYLYNQLTIEIILSLCLHKSQRTKSIILSTIYMLLATSRAVIYNYHLFKGKNRRKKKEHRRDASLNSMGGDKYMLILTPTIPNQVQRKKNKHLIDAAKNILMTTCGDLQDTRILHKVYRIVLDTISSTFNLGND
ncbi:hypothetical protein ACJX0J_031011, partial [Zea mays]